MSLFLRRIVKMFPRTIVSRAYIRLFSTSDGDIVLHDLALRCHLLTSHDGSPFAEGQRDVLLHIINNCNFTPKDFTILAESELEHQGDDT